MFCFAYKTISNIHMCLLSVHLRQSSRARRPASATQIVRIFSHRHRSTSPKTLAFAVLPPLFAVIVDAAVVGGAAAADAVVATTAT